MKHTKYLLTLSLAATAIIGDYIVFKSKFSESQVFRALLDSFIHASIGFLSALAFFSHDISISDSALWLNVAICTIISSFIDIDHVLVAKSLQWKDITNVKQRGIFHCTTLWLLITVALITYSHWTKKLNVYVLTWMLILAFTSHHIRDANRRGLWFYPYGHTPPLSKCLYVALISVLPSVFAVVYKSMKPQIYKFTTIEYVEV